MVSSNWEFEICRYMYSYYVIYSCALLGPGFPRGPCLVGGGG